MRLTNVILGALLTRNSSIYKSPKPISTRELLVAQLVGHPKLITSSLFFRLSSQLLMLLHSPLRVRSTKRLGSSTKNEYAHNAFAHIELAHSFICVLVYCALLKLRILKLRTLFIAHKLAVNDFKTKI